MLTYGMYLERGISIHRSSVIVTLADISVALLAGLVIFPSVFMFGLEPAMGAELAFTTLPQAFHFIPFGQVPSVIFFLMLFFAALTSAISMLEVNVRTIMKKMGMKRVRTSVLLIIGTLVVGIFPCLSYTGANLSLSGIRVLDIMDETVGTFGLPIAAIFISLVFSWYFERKELAAEIPRRWLPFVVLTIRYVIPIVLVIVTISTLIQAIL